MKTLVATIFFVFVSFLGFSQDNNSNIWYFGEYAGVDFNYGDPVALTDGQLNTWEGCASICNKFGEILFYTDGSKVYNRNHQIMPNGSGLLGDYSSSQSAIIVPKPHLSGENSFYYIFTTDNWQDNLENGFRYSVVDMTLDDGLGDITAEKNVLIHEKVAEKIAAIHHSNGIDIWVVTHDWGNNNYLAYKLTIDNLSLTPVVSSVGYYYTGNYNKANGQFKFTQNGNYLASTTQYVHRLEILKFNQTTGELSDLIYFQDSDLLNKLWGIEFSPNGEFLYFSKRPPNILYQLNIQEWDSLSILNTAEVIESTSGLPSDYDAGTLQLGPNRKIYLTRYDKTYLSVINQPNKIGSNCGFEQMGVDLSGRLNKWGLPNLFQNFLEADFTYHPDCYGDTTRFSLQYSGTIDSLSWNFGDPETGDNNYSNLHNPFHIFSAPGTYIVQLLISFGGSDYPIEKSVKISPVPFVDLGNDTTLCSQNGLLLEAGNGYDSYLWQDDSTDSVFLVSQTGDYWVRVENNCGHALDTIHIDFSSSFDIDIGNDTSFCYGQFVLLSPGGGFYSYFWQDGSTDSLMLAGMTGYYWVIVTDSLGCTATDSVYIESNMEFGFSLGPDTSIICHGDYIFLHGPVGYQSYLWQDGSNYLDFLADTAGIYWLEVTDENSCAARDSMFLIVNRVTDDFLGDDTIMCDGDYFIIHAPSFYEKYLWQDESTDSVFIAWQTGDYWVYVEDSIGCSGIDSISLLNFQHPLLTHSNDTLICPGDSLLLSPGGGMLYYLWNNGSTDSAIIVGKEDDYWVDMGTDCGLFTDSVFVGFYSNPNFSLDPDTNICHDESILLRAGSGFAAYLWSDGSTDSILIVTEKGDYSVLVDDGRCLLGDTVVVETCSLLWVPNVFTPNDDGFNDEFFAVAEHISDFKMTIFNRWGQILKTLNSIDEKWDGSFNNYPCPDAVYYWHAEFVEIDRKSETVKKVLQGSVTLIRGK